jgi:hypothetical protein
MLNTADPLGAPEAADGDFTEEFGGEPRIPQGWAQTANITRQSLLIGRLCDGHHSH